MVGGIRSESKAWISEFLLVRGVIGGPRGIALYQYHVTDEEYSKLPAILRKSFKDLDSPSYSIYWSAAFCLFVAEKYRREYDGSNLGWSWSGFEEPLPVELSSQIHREVVTKGLEFWKRPIRHRSNGYDYLGSLFDEGGIPWRLIKSKTHSFGRAVRAAVSSYYGVKELGGDIVSVIADYSAYFPQTFRTHDKYLLIASIVDWLMGLAETHPISSIDNPADYLDENAPEWRKQSPLPVSEGNARNLVNEWLKDAGRSRSEKKRLEANEKNYTCEHWLKGSYENWSIETEVFLPGEIEIELEGHSIQSTRVEIAFYEGDNLLKRSGVAYGKVSDDRSRIGVKISSRAIPVIRSRLELPLTVQFLSNGHRIHACYFEGSDVDYYSMPMVFFENGEKLKLASNASIAIPVSHAIVRLPESFGVETEGEYRELGNDSLAGQWIDIFDDATLFNESTNVALRFDPEAAAVKPILTGTIALYDTLPNLVYRGWPNLKFIGGADQGFRLFANGVPVQFDHQYNEVGSFYLSALGESGETILRRKVGVIPKDLKVMSAPASSNSSARLILKCSRNLSINLLSETIRSEVHESSGGYLITMRPKNGQKPPEKIRVAISNAVNTFDPVVLRIPYPNVGVQVFDDLGTEIKGDVLSLEQLIEMSMTLTPKPETREQFFVSLELVCPKLPNFRRYYRYTVNGQARRISLYAFEGDIQQMLGTTSNQDAFVRIGVETDRILKQLNIVRYDAHIVGPSAAGKLEVISDTRVESKNSVRVSGMRLDDPRATPVEVPEKVFQGVGLGVFEIPSKMMKNGPWLLFSPAESSAKFRPAVWVTEDSVITSEVQSDTLHSAAKTFHPVHNPHAFHQVISDMAQDLSHSGWDYLRALKEQYSALPLSALESWKALASNSSAIAAAVFRLEFDPGFCRRLSSELAVTWETVNVQTWINVRSGQYNFLVGQGMPEEFSENLVEDRLSSVASVIPCFKYLSSYLREPKRANLQHAPYFCVKDWFDDLRRNHADDDRWPEWFKIELTNWVQQQGFPTEITTLPDENFTRAVTFLPVFMAAVTAGKANFTDLSESLPELRFAVRVLSDFDRDAWYDPIYSLVLSNLLLEAEE